MYKTDTDVFVDVGDSLTIFWSIKNGTTVEYFNYFNYSAPVSAVLPKLCVFSQGSPSDTSIYLPIEKALELFEYSNLGVASALYLELSEYSDEVLDTETSRTS